MQQYIECQKDGCVYRFDHRISQFCQLLKNQYSQEKIFVIPNVLVGRKQHFEIINKFVEMHKYDINKVVTLAKNKNQQQQSNSITQQFVRIYLAPLNIQIIKQLLKLCEYLQIQSLKRIICEYLSRKYDPGYSHQTIQKHLNEYQVNKLTKQSIQELKIKYKDYFTYFAKKLEW